MISLEEEAQGERKEWEGTGSSNQPWENQDVEGQLRLELHKDQEREGQFPPPGPP